MDVVLGCGVPGCLKGVVGGANVGDDLDVVVTVGGVEEGSGAVVCKGGEVEVENVGGGSVYGRADEVVCQTVRGVCAPEEAMVG